MFEARAYFQVFVASRILGLFFTIRCNILGPQDNATENIGSLILDIYRQTQRANRLGYTFLPSRPDTKTSAPAHLSVRTLA
jgi:hypothetical protein